MSDLLDADFLTAAARKVVRLRRSMRLALRCLDDAEITSPEARRLANEARRIMRLALEVEDGQP